MQRNLIEPEHFIAMKMTGDNGFDVIGVQQFYPSATCAFRPAFVFAVVIKIPDTRGVVGNDDCFTPEFFQRGFEFFYGIESGNVEGSCQRFRVDRYYREAVIFVNLMEFTEMMFEGGTGGAMVFALNVMVSGDIMHGHVKAVHNLQTLFYLGVIENFIIQYIAGMHGKINLHGQLVNLLNDPGGQFVMVALTEVCIRNLDKANGSGVTAGQSGGQSQRC